MLSKTQLGALRRLYAAKKLNRLTEPSTTPWPWQSFAALHRKGFADRHFHWAGSSRAFVYSITDAGVAELAKVDKGVVR
jgi:hypothetical protein